jgi:hypothetical protein
MDDLEQRDEPEVGPDDAGDLELDPDETENVKGGGGAVTPHVGPAPPAP